MAGALGCALVSILLSIRTPGAAGFEPNDDGRELIRRAAQASADDLGGRPLVEDKAWPTSPSGSARPSRPPGWT
jgi:hypothetical protein